MDRHRWGNVPDHVAAYRKFITEREVSELRDRGDGCRASGEPTGGWFTEQEIVAMKERTRRMQHNFYEGAEA